MDGQRRFAVIGTDHAAGYLLMKGDLKLEDIVELMQETFLLSS